jgi:hypothetical protein
MADLAARTRTDVADEHREAAPTRKRAETTPALVQAETSPATCQVILRQPSIGSNRGCRLGLGLDREKIVLLKAFEQLGCSMLPA